LREIPPTNSHFLTKSNIELEGQNYLYISYSSNSAEEEEEEEKEEEAD
jgi:hypothetical protein